MDGHIIVTHGINKTQYIILKDPKFLAKYKMRAQVFKHSLSNNKYAIKPIIL